METMDVFNVKMCWGNLGFDYVHSDSVGNSGGILCVWDPYSFIWGLWLKTGNNTSYFVYGVLAPHDLKKCICCWTIWRMISIRGWGKVVNKGDFNDFWYKSDRALDADIDKGNGTADMVTKRSEVVNSLQEIDKLQTMEIAQKAKIKWCIEGDENSSFFHGMLNKRRSQLSIRGIMVDGVWIEDPLKIDLECDVTKEELKKAVWDCGIDKSPGPDGFTFGFYRRFWSTIENDVFEAVKYFFNSGAIPNGCNSSFIPANSPNIQSELIMESLHLSFQRVVDAGMFKGVQLNPSLNLSHMFYADDAVFVGQWCDDNINILTSTKVGGSMSRTHAWEEVIDKVRSRLSRWKMKTLSIGGRLTLLKSVLGSMPIFHMSIFKAPLSVIRQLESIRSHFFNGHDSASRKASWIKWDCVLAPKEKGGLGVSSLYALNRALMFKWVWRFYSQNSSLWARVMKAIHGDDGRIGKDIKACNQSCWLNIVNEINVLKNQGINFLDFMRLKLGNGNNISFWNDNWIGGNTLKNLYPRIYALENSKQVTVCAKLADIALDASFRRKPRGDGYGLWKVRDFSVASTRKAIDDLLLIHFYYFDKRLPVVNSKTRWIKSVPIKILSCALFVILAWSLLVISSSRVIWPDSFHVRSLNGGLPLLSKLIPMVNGALGSCRCGSPPNTN
ncbi:hypothetical protein Tco_0775914 [Tanacetum coccineum]